MEASAKGELVDAWIALQKAERDSAEHERLFWAHDALWEMATDRPEEAWKMILAILSRDQSQSTMQNLSAGPLEDLLGYHGVAFIDRVESQARRDPIFAKLLGGVWQNRMPDEIWLRVQAVWDRRGWDDIPE